MNTTMLRAGLAATLLGAGLAQAQEPILVESDTWPQALTQRPLTLKRNMVEVTVPVGINMSKDLAGKPTTVAPSLYYGLTDRWMVGVRHFSGLCLTGADEGCPNVYEDVSVDTLISFIRAGGIDLAIGGAVNAAPLQNPTTWSGEARLVARAYGGPLALTIAPTVNFGFNKRDTANKVAPYVLNLSSYNILTPFSIAGNRELLTIPASLQLQLGSYFAVAASGALQGPLGPPTGTFGDLYTIPIGFAAVVTPIRWLDVGADFVFPNLAGKGHTSDTRSLGFFVAFRI